MPYAREAFETLGETVVLDDRAIAREAAHDARILAIRSTTRVDSALLAGSAVEFVGTATIGTDHLDTAFLDSAGIQWRYSPGCNANSVSEYIAAALLCLATRNRFTLEGKTIGVIGVGNVGRLVVEKASALGMRALENDPPRERAEDGGQKAKFVALDHMLAEADIVTCHVPLTFEGPDATFHLADETFFAKMKQGCIFINSARGRVVDTAALLSALDVGKISHAVVDTWEGEPAYSRELLERVALGTPHIAGYSFDGKVTGTLMVYRQACAFLGVEPVWNPEKLLPAPSVPHLTIAPNKLVSSSEDQILWDIVRQVYDIEADDCRLRETCVNDSHARALSFSRLRKNYPMRREFRFTRIAGADASSGLAAKISRLGFLAA